MRPIIYQKLKLENISHELTDIHLARPFSHEVALQLLSRAPRLKDITLSNSTYLRLSEKTINLLKERDIVIRKKNVAGRALSIELEKLIEIIQMKKYGDSLRTIGKEYGLAKSTVHYLFKYAKRNKLYVGKKTVILDQ